MVQKSRPNFSNREVGFCGFDPFGLTGESEREVDGKERRKKQIAGIMDMGCGVQYSRGAGRAQVQRFHPAAGFCQTSVFHILRQNWEKCNLSKLFFP